jgi:hypothetical protein
MLSLWRRKPEPEPAAATGGETPEPVRRRSQQNIKVSEDCGLAFDALAKAHGISKAALFEDMVAERLALAERQGLRLKIG